MIIMKPDMSSTQNWFQKFLNISKFFTCLKQSNEPISVRKIIPKFRISEHKENCVDFCKIVTKTTYFKNTNEEQQVIFFLEPLTLLVALLPIYLWGFLLYNNKWSSKSCFVYSLFRPNCFELNTLYFWNCLFEQKCGVKNLGNKISTVACELFCKK